MEDVIGIYDENGIMEEYFCGLKWWVVSTKSNHNIYGIWVRCYLYVFLEITSDKHKRPTNYNLQPKWFFPTRHVMLFGFRESDIKLIKRKHDKKQKKVEIYGVAYSKSNWKFLVIWKTINRLLNSILVQIFYQNY